jgi:allophanate hydrolase subunit 1
VTETRTRKTQDKDVVSRVAGAGEDVLRGLFSLPRRILAATLDGVGDVLHGAATLLGNVDPLDTRVAELEKRLESLEKTAGTRGTTPTRTKPAERRGEHAATQPRREGDHAQ